MSEPDNPTSELFDALGHSYRRAVVAAVVAQSPDAVTVDPEAAVAAASDDAPDALGDALYHVHLPKLAAAGYIDWDRDASRVAPGPRFDELQPFVDLLGRHPDVLPGGWP
jgi:hypothetical protein